MIDGVNIGPNYSDEDVADLLKYVTMLTLIAAISTSHFLGWTKAYESSLQLFDEFLEIKVRTS